jgi:protein-S-isoprenylcysteine O-methyltransferase Ste14
VRARTSDDTTGYGPPVPFAHNQQMKVAGSIVLICWAVFAIVWIVGAFTAKPAAEEYRGWPRWWYRVPIFVVLVLLSWRRSAVSLSVTLWSASWAAAISADALAIVGVAIAIWSRVALGVYWSGDVVMKDAHVIIDRGPYRFVRHPIYSGVLLMALATALLWGRLDGFAVFAVVCAGLVIKSRFEERLLSTRLPVEYERYKARVRHVLVPGLL